MQGMTEQAHVKLSGDTNGRYVVTDQRAGGELTRCLVYRGRAKRYRLCELGKLPSWPRRTVCAG
jgi:hypothetical protein